MIALYRNVVRQQEQCVCVCVCLSLHVCAYMLLGVFVKCPAHEQAEVCAYDLRRYTRVCV